MKKILSRITIFQLTSLCLLQKPASAQISVDSTDIAKLQGFEIIFASVVTTVGSLVGFGFFIMLLVGGIRYLLSGGDPKALQAAKGTLTWAIIGLALFALSFTILLIIQAFTGVNVTIFRLTI